MKINVIGTIGSGKSTFSRNLAKILSIKYIEMDALVWGKNWSMSTDEQLFSKLKAELGNSNWVLDGNYMHTAPIKWDEVDTIIWLDYSFIRTLYQIIKRSISHAASKHEIWPDTGFKETFKKFYFSKHSILLWMLKYVLKKYKINKVKYNELMTDQKYAHIKFVHLRSPKECQKYLKSLQNQNLSQLSHNKALLKTKEIPSS